MTQGNSTTESLADSLPTVISAARLVREYEGVMPQLVDRVRLGEGIGLSWHEISLAQLTAQTVSSENQKIDNAQQITDALFSVTPTISVVHTFVSDKVAKRIAKVAFAKLGALAQNSIQRKKDEDGLVAIDGSTTSLSGAGTTLSFGVVSAASVRISSNTTEPSSGQKNAVLHGFQIQDIWNDLTGGVGSAPIPEGLTSQVLKDGYRGSINGAKIYEDGNIAIDGDADAKGGVFAKEAFVLVEGSVLMHETRREPDIGGGGTSLWVRDEFAYGERSQGNWSFEIWSDATAPSA